jgi:phosphoglycolate phosphatase-like HAD superfamily hydrolase
MKKTTWFFDLDGTLADTSDDIIESFRKTIVDLGLDEDRFNKLFVIGPTIDDIIKKMYPELYSQELCDKVRSGFSKYYDVGDFPLTKEYPGIIDEIKRLKASGAKVFIVTNKRWKATKLMAEHFGWNAIFDGLYSSDMYKDGPLGVLKKPELLAHVIRENFCDVDSCVMVGDTINDFEAAKANGVYSVAVPWGYGKSDELAQASCIYSGQGPLL